MRHGMVLHMLVSAVLSAVMAPMAKADELRYLPTGELSLAQRFLDIKNAKKSIDLTTYEFDPCSHSTRMLVDLLSRKAAEGVKVRMILDGHPLPPQLRRSLTKAFDHRGIELRFYNPVFTLSPGVNHRTHSKLLLIDSKRYISGGRNLSDQYFGMSHMANLIDRDIRVEGASAKGARERFERSWNSKMVRRVPLMGAAGTAGTSELEKQCLTQLPGDQERFDYIISRGKEVLPETPTVSCKDVEFTMDDERFVNTTSGGSKELVGARLDFKETTKKITELIESTKKKLVIENWLYIPKGRIKAKLNELRNNGISVRLFTNMVPSKSGPLLSEHLEASLDDNRGSQKVFLLSPFGSMNSEWGLTPQGVAGERAWQIHAKTLVIDDEHTVVSSFNLDARSYDINSESAVIVRHCPALAATVSEHSRELRKAFERDAECAKCRELPPLDLFDKIIGNAIHNLL